jgi:DNA-binding MarR family transcriptional regulator
MAAAANLARTIETEDGPLNLSGLSDRLDIHLRLAHAAIYRDFKANLTRLDLSQSLGAALILIGANPGITQTDMSGALGINRTTIMQMIDRLALRRLVRRRRSTSDRRYQTLFLTAAGKALLGEARAVIRRHEAQFVERFTPAELEALVASLGRIHRRV